MQPLGLLAQVQCKYLGIGVCMDREITEGEKACGLSPGALSECAHRCHWLADRYANPFFQCLLSSLQELSSLAHPMC